MKKNKFIGVLLALVLSTGTVVSTTVSNKENKLLNPVSSSAVVFSSSPSGIYKVKRNINAAILNSKYTNLFYDEYSYSSVRFCSGDLIYSNGTTVWGINATSKYPVEYLRCYYYGSWVWVEKNALSLSLRMPV